MARCGCTSLGPQWCLSRGPSREVSLLLHKLWSRHVLLRTVPQIPRHRGAAIPSALRCLDQAKISHLTICTVQDGTGRVRGDVLHAATHGKCHRSLTNFSHDMFFLGRLHIFLLHEGAATTCASRCLPQGEVSHLTVCTQRLVVYAQFQCSCASH